MRIVLPSAVTPSLSIRCLIFETEILFTERIARRVVSQVDRVCLSFHKRTPCHCLQELFRKASAIGVIQKNYLVADM